MQRITSLSKANLLAAERAELIETPAGVGMLKVWRGDRSAFVSGAVGPLTFADAAHVRRFVRRYRVDLAELMTTI